ncbi:hypothetical protein VTN96DRAFT_1152 [Rasamsonia emersonii]
MVLERDSRAFARVSAEEEEAGQKADKYRRPLSWSLRAQRPGGACALATLEAIVHLAMRPMTGGSTWSSTRAIEDRSASDKPRLKQPPPRPEIALIFLLYRWANVLLEMPGGRLSGSGE